MADATSRRVLLDSGFMSNLRQHLGWHEPRDPSLSDLHPSLGNANHVQRMILELRGEKFPGGTGFESKPEYTLLVAYIN